MIALVVASSLVTLLCAAASLERLRRALGVTTLDPDVLTRVAERDGPEALVARLAAWTEAEGASTPDDAFERSLVALAGPSPAGARALGQGHVDDEAHRTAVLAEALLELEQRARAWGKVPRVCASVATTSGFLLASLALRQGLAAGALGADLRQLFFTGLVGQAIAVVALGIAGATFCAHAHRVSHRIAMARLRSAQALAVRFATSDTV